MNTYNFEIKSEYDKNQFINLHNILSNNEKKIIVVCGMPSSGKTTLINNIIKDYPFYTYIENNDLINDNLININQPIILELNNPASKKYKKLIRYLNNYQLYFIFINCPLKIILQRNNQVLAEDKYLPDFILKHKYIYISSSYKNSIFLNVYEQETNYIPQYKNINFKKDQNNIKIKLSNLYNCSLNNIENYRAAYKISYIRDKSAKEQLLNLFNCTINNINDYIQSLNWDNILPAYKICINYNQNTKYHKYVLHEHMYRSALIAKEQYNADYLIFLSLFFHDIGKPYCMIDTGIIKEKTNVFKPGEKVNIKQGNNGLILASKLTKNSLLEELLIPQQIKINKNSHFYGHEYFGAKLLHQQLSLLNFSTKELSYIYRYVLNHMIINNSNKLSNKILKNILFWNKDILNELYVIHKSDIEATEYINQSYFDINFNRLIKLKSM